MPEWMEQNSLPPRNLRVLFLGDSITDNGLYIAYLDAYFRLRHPGLELSLIPLGVSSETASGLSEDRHPFPRPRVHDRLDRALDCTGPDWVVCCYGMNDGIYHPLSKSRFEAFKEGMLTLTGRIKSTGAKAIVLTPPPFDALSFSFPAEPKPDYSYLSPYREYDRVLEAYARWVLSPELECDGAIDVRTPLREDTGARRAQDPGYSSGDGIHPNAAGHGVMAQTLLARLFGAPEGGIPDFPAAEKEWPWFPLVLQRHRLLAAAWKEHVGHTHPVKAQDAVPLDTALTEARRLEGEIRLRIAGEKPESCEQRTNLS